MKMKFKSKSLFKKIALVLAGVAALTAVAFGVKAIVDYTKNDLKKITPTFEVGNLGNDGKYIDDKSTLYTKDAFACYGLQVKLDFNSTVNYQIFYYDVLDNYISSTDLLGLGYSGEAPVNGAYARILIVPKNDEDGKISLTERVKYSSQLTIKVNKNQDINNRFVVYKGRVLQVVNDISDLVFVGGLRLDANAFVWGEHDSFSTTATTVLNVNGGSTLSFDSSKLESEDKFSFTVFEFKDLPSDDSFVGSLDVKEPVQLNKSTKYIIINVYRSAGSWNNEQLSKLPKSISITKTK